jgi:hypothetical protein
MSFAHAHDDAKLLVEWACTPKGKRLPGKHKPASAQPPLSSEIASVSTARRRVADEELL